jgi:hypothetical protein
LKENLANPVRKAHKPDSSMNNSNPDKVNGKETDQGKKKRKKIVWKDNPMRPKTPIKVNYERPDYLKLQ